MKRQTKRVSRKQYNLVLICLILLSVISAYLGLDLAARKVRASQELLWPISNATVIEVERIKEVPVNVEVLNTNILDLVDYVWMKESTRGKNTNPQALHNYCKSIGRSNEFGMGGMRLKLCYENHKQARAIVTLWFAERLKEFNGNVSMSLCYYNLGEKITNCPYAEKYGSQ